MSLRIKRLWQPGNPQLRVFLPDFWVSLVETPVVGAGRVPKNCVKFEVDKRMSRHDVREYLEKIYNLPIRDVRIMVKEEIEWNKYSISRYNRALWKEDEKKYAYVFLKKGVEFEFPDLLIDTEEEKELEKFKESFNKMKRADEKEANKYRQGSGKLFNI